MPGVRFPVPVTLLFVAAIGVSGCSSDDGEVSCVEGAGGQVCARVDDGALVVTGNGLQAGSTVTFRINDGEPIEWTVSATGDIPPPSGGQLGLLNVTGFQSVGIEAVAADGTPINGELSFD
jgi:hypothetical protein